MALATFAVAMAYTISPSPQLRAAPQIHMCEASNTLADEVTPPQKPAAGALVRGVMASFTIAASYLAGGAIVAANEPLQQSALTRRLPGAAWAADLTAAPQKSLSSGQQKRLKQLLKTKLSKVPVFMVTNEGGSPFLNRLASGDQSALMFLYPGGAQKMLDGVLKAPNGASSGAKVLSTNLDRAFKLARLDPAPSGLRDQYSNRDLTMVWQFTPHASEQRAAQLYLAKTGKLAAPTVPAYMVEGLTLTKRGKEVTPVFFSKKDVDAALAAVAEQDGEGASGKILVYDALELILQLSRDVELGNPDVEGEIKSIEFVPASESLEFRDQLKKDKPQLKAKIVPPSHY